VKRCGLDTSKLVMAKGRKFFLVENLGSHQLRKGGLVSAYTSVTDIDRIGIGLRKALGKKKKRCSPELVDRGSRQIPIDRKRITSSLETIPARTGAVKSCGGNKKRSIG